MNVEIVTEAAQFRLCSVFFPFSYKELIVYILINSTYCCLLSLDHYFVGMHERGLLFKNLTKVLIEIISRVNFVTIIVKLLCSSHVEISFK
jgi:hypothetical protein